MHKTECLILVCLFVEMHADNFQKSFMKLRKLNVL